MALIVDKNIAVFDFAEIHRGDVIRFKRVGDKSYRNGLVTKITEERIEAIYSNIQNDQMSFLQINAADVSTGAWEIYWTTDFQAISHLNGGDASG